MFMSSVKLADVAVAAGLSISGVSKALANSAEISDGTRERVQRIAVSMGYHSNTLARSLRLGRSNLLGVIIPSSDNPFYSSVLQGIAEVARIQGYTIIIATSNDTVDGEAMAVSSLVSVPVSGILSVPVSFENYQSVTQPLVYLSRYPYRLCKGFSSTSPSSGNDSYVINDDFEGQRIATGHLLDRGYQTIFLYLDAANPKSLSTYKAMVRLDGYRQQLENAGLSYNKKNVFLKVDTIESSYATTKALCEKHPKGEFAICATNDYVSIGALTAIREAGLRVPEQVALIGYDGIELGAYFFPPITTINIANKELGRHGATHLHAVISGQIDRRQNITTILNPFLLNRQST